MTAVKPLLASFVCGLLFGFGLALSGMTDPQRVRGFLDVTGIWDPTLLAVMGGALATATPGFRFARRRRAPVLAVDFRLPTAKDIDLRLLAGAVVFGCGWGLAGYCPGPALTSIAAGTSAPWLFIVAMIAGMVAAPWIESRFARTRMPGK
jgi:uncharacterized membrane protein YedE/YeeE